MRGVTLKSPKYSIITIINNKSTFDEFSNSLSQQRDVAYELIKINNCDNEFTSARSAYNYGATLAKGDFLIFCHPDIRFLDEYSLFNICKFTQDQEDFGIMGIAGSPRELKNNNRVLLSTIIHGDNKVHAGDSNFSHAIEVQTLDECFFMMTKNFWELHPFSNQNGWHLYAVEQCIIANLNNQKNYVIPARIWHTSDGKSEDYHYYIYLRQLIHKYRNYLPETLNTTVKKFPTHGIAVNLCTFYWILNRWTKHFFHIKIK